MFNWRKWLKGESTQDDALTHHKGEVILNISAPIFELAESFLNMKDWMCIDTIDSMYCATYRNVHDHKLQLIFSLYYSGNESICRANWMTKDEQQYMGRVYDQYLTKLQNQRETMRVAANKMTREAFAKVLNDNKQVKGIE